MPSPPPTYFSPADILIFIRESGPCSLLGVARHARVPQGTLGLRAGGRLITELSQLEGAGLIARTGPEPRPEYLLGVKGAETTYQVTDQLARIQGALGLSLSTLKRAQKARERDAVRALQVARQRAEAVVVSDASYREDFLRTLEEMAIAFSSGCFIAVLALAGKTLELALKQRLGQLGIGFDDNLMLGLLIKKVTEAGDYVDPALGHTANIINQSRIPAVHAKRAVPVPSEEQAAMVVNAVLDVLNRTMLADGGITKARA
jgi:hypothetical protein